MLNDNGWIYFSCEYLINSASIKVLPQKSPVLSVISPNCLWFINLRVVRSTVPPPQSTIIKAAEISYELQINELVILYKLINKYPESKKILDEKYKWGSITPIFWEDNTLNIENNFKSMLFSDLKYEYNCLLSDHSKFEDFLA